MKLVLLLLAFSFGFTQTNAQTNGSQIISFPEIGWRITIPEDFQLIDSATRILNVPNMPDYWQRSVLFRWNKASLRMGISKTDSKHDNVWINSFEKENNHFYKSTLENRPTLTYDTVSTIELINSVPFQKFIMQGRSAGVLMSQHIKYRTFYRNYRFIINWTGTNETDTKLVETLLKESQFFN